MRNSALRGVLIGMATQIAIPFSTACAEPQSRIAIFDLDRTLTRRGTYSPFLIFAAKRLCPWRLTALPWVVLGMIGYKCRILSRSRLKELMQRTMMGAMTEIDRLEPVVDAFAQHILKTGIYPEAFTQIARERAVGSTIVIASAAHHFYLEPLARTLGADYVIGTRSTMVAGRLSFRIAGQNCYGAEKSRRISEFLLRAGSALGKAEICFYSDDLSDLPSFGLADDCIAVNPSRSLKKLALRNNWRIMDWRAGR